MSAEGNDPLLHPLIEADEEEVREGAIATIAERAGGVAQRVLRRFHGQLDRDDTADVASTVMLRLVRRLRELTAGDAAIASVDDFVATLTYNASYDFLRRRQPEKTRHKNRLRYVLLHDDRLALWDSGGGMACGLAQWRGATTTAKNVSISRDDAKPRMLDRNATGDALLEIFKWHGEPLLFVDLAQLTAELWLVAEQEFVDVSNAVDAGIDPTIQLEQRQYLERLWREIRDLRPTQRSALLLNLRDSDGMNAVALLIFTGITTYEDVAAALEITPARLHELWPRMPINDLEIAEMLGMTRQQVINLRRAARERLGRRMNMKNFGWQ